MSTNKDKEMPKDELVLLISKEGSTKVAFFPVSLSTFVIDYVYSKEQRESAASTNTRRIYCG